MKVLLIVWDRRSSEAEPDPEIHPDFKVLLDLFKPSHKNALTVLLQRAKSPVSSLRIAEGR